MAKHSALLRLYQALSHPRLALLAVVLLGLLLRSWAMTQQAPQQLSVTTTTRAAQRCKMR